MFAHICNDDLARALQTCAEQGYQADGADADDGDYRCEVSCDANGNITELHEMDKPGETSLADFYTNFCYG